MNEPMNKSIKGCRTFDEVLDTEYGKSGTPERNAFECEAEAFVLAEREIYSFLLSSKSFKGLGRK